MILSYLIGLYLAHREYRQREWAAARAYVESVVPGRRYFLLRTGDGFEAFISDEVTHG